MQIKLLLIALSFVTQIYASESFILSVPETSVKVTLLSKSPSHYTDGYERGIVKGDFTKILREQNVTLLPFVVSNQGSGVFYYIALFKDHKHIRSFFIGDRVVLVKIQREEDLLKVFYTSREGKKDYKEFSTLCSM